jgi:hypothetical protein
LSNNQNSTIKELDQIEKLLQGENLTNGTNESFATVGAPQSISKMKDPKSGKFIAKAIKYILLFLVLFSSCFLILFAIYLTGLDLRFAKITLNLSVTDQSEAGLGGVQVFVNDAQIGLTDSKGKYSITGLDPGTLDFKLSSEGFLDFVEVVQIDRDFFQYSTQKDIKLISAVKATLNGQFNPVIENYKFSDSFIVIKSLDGKEIDKVKVAENGEFTLPEITTGKILFGFESPDFMDVEREIMLEPGINRISSINLNPAGDILESYQSYVTNSAINQISILVENHNPDFVSIDYESQTFLVKDLSVGRDYTIRVEAEGFEPRDYNINVQRGYNEIFDLVFVEQGRAVYFGSLDSKTQGYLYASDFDGNDFTQLSDINNLNPNYIYYNKDKDLIYLTTEIDRVRSIVSGSVGLVYSLDPETKVLNKLTTNTSQLGSVTPNFIAEKLINVYKKDRRDLTYSIELRNLDGNSAIPARTTENNFSVNKVLLSNDSTILYSQEENITTQEKSIFVIEIGKETKLVSDKNESNLLNITSDGKLALFMANETSKDFFDLFLYNFETSETRKVFTNYQGFNIQFLGDSNEELIFMQTVDEIENIYKYRISSNQTEVVTRLTRIYDISAIYQQSDFVFYITNRGLHILDPQKVQSFKLVKEGGWLVR